MLRLKIHSAFERSDFHLTHSFLRPKENIKICEADLLDNTGQRILSRDSCI